MAIKEVAACLKLPENTAYRLTPEGKIPSFKVGGSWQFWRGNIAERIEEQKGS